MAQHMTSGKVLRETRERKNYDLTTVARRLRIRPDILRAIEAGDFASMPPRGYARNMVNAYARLLGLNPTEIVNMYLDEAYAYQVEKARGAAPGSGFIMDSYVRRPRIRARTTREAGAASRRDAQAASFDEPAQERRAANRSRHLYDDRTPYSRDDYGVARDRVGRPGRSDRDFLSHHSGYSSGGYDLSGERAARGSERRSRTRDIHVGQTPMQYSASRLPGIFQSRAVLIGAIALVVLVLAVAFFVFTRGSQPAQDDVSQLPVSGISDTTGADEADEVEAAQVEVAPTSARVMYSVASGDTCYIETYADGQQDAQMLTGPAQNSVEVTGTWTITTWSPDTIEVTVNGEEVELVSSSEYGGMYAYTVNFPELLAEWNKAHGTKSSQRQAAVASAANAASHASSSESLEDEQEDASSGSNSGSSSSASASMSME